MDDVRSIDETQVPTDLNLMGVLKKAMLSDKVLWGNLQFNSDGMTLSHMMDIMSKWNPKETKPSNAVANYSAFAGQSKEGSCEEAELGPRQRQGQDRPSSRRNESMPRLQERWALGKRLPKQGGEGGLARQEGEEAKSQ